MRIRKANVAAPLEVVYIQCGISIGLWAIRQACLLLFAHMYATDLPIPSFIRFATLALIRFTMAPCADAKTRADHPVKLLHTTFCFCDFEVVDPATDYLLSLEIFKKEISRYNLN